ncbi:serine hydrolase domain-containing protein [Yinghuangia aomiensis]|uniref:Serine hydrolase domain-containing protein n=1 Tax=Yinghuangia aomiensis TaxID=676205 RepID=A0ABP9H2D6_9ACTN
MPELSDLGAAPDIALATLFDRRAVPGAAVGIMHGDEDHVAAEGVLTLGAPDQVTADTLFRIGSVTKTVTATAVASLAEAGAVDLAEHVAAYIPDLRLSGTEARSRLRVWHLLSHVAGWQGDQWVDTGSGDDALERFAVDVLPHLPQVTPVGRCGSYNNTAVMLAGLLIERVTGLPYADAVTEQVLKPLGMAASRFAPDEVARLPLASGHRLDHGMPVADRLGDLPRAFDPTGGLASSVRDQLRYMRFHVDGAVSGGPSPLSPAARADMRRVRASLGPDRGVGLGWFVRRRDGRQVVGHSGNVSDRYLTTMLLVPEERFGIVVLSNASGGKGLGEDLVEWALQTRLGMPPLQPLPAVRTPLEQYEGRYRAGSWRIDITQDHAALTAHLTFDDDPTGDPPVRLRLVGPDVVATEERPGEPAGDFIRNPDGSIGWFRWALRLASKEET